MRSYRRLLLRSVAIGLTILGTWAVLHLPAAGLTGFMHTQVPMGYERRWLARIPCAPPCWEGVTPGRTTVQEALRLWNADPGIVPGSAIINGHAFDNRPTGYITWQWVGGAQGGIARYTAGVGGPVIAIINPQ